MGWYRRSINNQAWWMASHGMAIHHVHPLPTHPSPRKSKPASSSKAPSRLVAQNRRAGKRATNARWETDPSTWETGLHRTCPHR